MTDLAITYIGGPTATLSVGGVTFMTDPTFDPAGGDYASGKVTLHKTRGPALQASELGPIDVVLLSHEPACRQPGQGRPGDSCGGFRIC